MADWHNEEEFLLINLYERFPVLWNSEDIYYNDLVKKHQAWREIAMTLGKSVEEVQKKMSSMKNLFRWEKSKLKKQSQNETAQGQDNTYSSTWLPFKNIEFATDGANEPRKQVNSENADIASGDRVTDDDAHDTQYRKTGENPDNSTPVDETHDGAPILTTLTTQVLSRIGSTNNNGKNPKACCKIFNNVSGVAIKDECDNFGSYVAGKLRGFDRRTRAKLEHEITAVLLNGELGRCKPPAFSDSSVASSTSSSPQQFYMSTSPPPSSTPIKCKGPKSSHLFQNGTFMFNETPVPRSFTECLHFSDGICLTTAHAMSALTYSSLSPINSHCNSFEESSSILISD